MPYLDEIPNKLQGRRKHYVLLDIRAFRRICARAMNTKTEREYRLEGIQISTDPIIRLRIHDHVLST